MSSLAKLKHLQSNQGVGLTLKLTVELQSVLTRQLLTSNCLYLKSSGDRSSAFRDQTSANSSTLFALS